MKASSIYGRLSLGLVVAFLATAYSLEYWQHLPPCSLCLLQRWILWGIGALLIIQFLVKRSSLRWVAGGLLSLALLSGLALAGRHLFIQYQALHQAELGIGDPSMQCLGDLNALLQSKPWTEALTLILKEHHDCQIIHTFLGAPLSVWSGMGFLMLSLLQILRLKSGQSES